VHIPGKKTVFASFLVFVLGTLSVMAGKTEIIVFAAASLTESFRELETRFEARHPGADVVLNLASSYHLAQQLCAGAPGDVFASANERQMEAVVSCQRVDVETVRRFARNRLVVVMPQGNPADVKQFSDLARPGLRLVLAAEETPIGAYTRQMLQTAASSNEWGQEFMNAVIENTASFEENVKAVFSKVLLGEADAGVVYVSDTEGDDSGIIRTMQVPDSVNVLASYPVAIVNDSQEKQLAGLFLEFLLSKEGKDCLAAHGFMTVWGEDE
jgi:molybdate transport system substrate-binding protein